mgnify:CR=1 FL=1
MMTPGIQTNGMFEAMAVVTAGLGKRDIAEALVGVIKSICPVDSVCVMAFPKDARPKLLHENTVMGVVAPAGDMTQYLDGAYLLDPFYQAAKAQKATGCYALKELAPDDFFNSEYFRLYYRFSHLVDELAYLLALDDGSYIHVSIAKVEAFSETERSTILAITPWVLSVLERQWAGTNLKTEVSANDIDMHKHVRHAFEHFGSSVLTERECEIARLILHGHSTKSMAVKLDISIETVKVHRRNLYQKLDISSQPELFSLFLESLAVAGGDDHVDPLQAYHQPVHSTL